jgi:tetratricopeptide (TPR) repeat protein
LRALAERFVLVALGVVLAFGLLEGGLRAAGMVFLARQEARNRAARAASGDAATVLCIGESTTALGGADSYPSQLQDVLNEHGRRVTVVNKGIPAITTDVIVADLPGWLETYRPAVVVAMMGVNDPPDDVLGTPLVRALQSLRTYKLAAWLAGGIRRRFAPPPETLAQEHAHIKSVAAAHPNDADAGADLAEVLLAEQHGTEARATLERALALRPGDPRLRILLARMSYATGDAARAVATLEALAAEAPDDARRQAAVAMEYLLGGDLERADALLAKHPDVRAYEFLEAGYYERAARALAAGHPDEAEAILDATIRRLPSIRLGQLLHKQRAFIARARGDQATFESELAMVRRLGAARGSTTTARNFGLVRLMLKEHGIPLIAAQYPLRDVASLEELLAHDPGIVFVDNERLFRDAVATAPWEAYFTDAFAGDFGHLNRAGNRMLAENVARAVEAALDAVASRPPPR